MMFRRETVLQPEEKANCTREEVPIRYDEKKRIEEHAVEAGMICFHPVG